MENNDAWYRGMAVAAFILQVKTLNRLRLLGILDADSTKEIIDAALLDLEGREGAIPDEARVVNKQARTHLETIQVS